jgi:hypothetical protein
VDHARLVTKRIVIATLWLFAGWYGGAYAVAYLGLPDVVAPLVGVAAACFVTVVLLYPTRSAEEAPVADRAGPTGPAAAGTPRRGDPVSG